QDPRRGTRRGGAPKARRYGWRGRVAVLRPRAAGGFQGAGEGGRLARAAAAQRQRQDSQDRAEKGVRTGIGSGVNALARPLVVGIGGAAREGSSTNRVLAAALA